MMMADAIMVTGARMEAPAAMERSAAVVTAQEENLGDLKLFRVPGRVDVSAKGMKQVAFLDKDSVEARQLYQAACDPNDWIGEAGAEPAPATMLLVTKNEEGKGLGMALPQGMMTVYEPTRRGPQASAQTPLRDYARGQDIELEVAESAQVFVRCARINEDDLAAGPRQWIAMRAALTNANPHPITLRLQASRAGSYDVRFKGRKVVVKNGWQTVELTIPANTTRDLDWSLRAIAGE